MASIRDIRDLRCLSEQTRTSIVSAAHAGTTMVVSATWVQACLDAQKLLPCQSEDKRATLPRWNVLDHRHCFAGVIATITQVAAESCFCAMLF